MYMTLSVLGLIGGVLCAIADMLLDLKGKDNQKLGKNGLVDSKWEYMSEWRFKVSILVVMIAVPLYAMGLWEDFLFMHFFVYYLLFTKTVWIRNKLLH